MKNGFASLDGLIVLLELVVDVVIQAILIVAAMVFIVVHGDHVNKAIPKLI